MEKITEFFKEFKNRVTNPLFFSFIISWVIINWKVTVGILLYNSKNIGLLQYKNYYDLILDNCSGQNYFWKPLGYAALYTFLFPPLRLIIVSFLSLFKKWTNNLNLRIMGNANVPMNRFIKETERSDKLAKTLEDLYKKDSTIKIQNEKLLKDINELNQKLSGKDGELTDKTDEIRSLSYKLEQFSKLESTAILNGMWRVAASISALCDVRYFDDASNSNKDKKAEILISFYNGKIQLVSEEKEIFEYGELIGFAFNYDLNTAQLILKRKLLFPERLIPFRDSPLLLTYQYLHVHFDEEGNATQMKGQDDVGNYFVYTRDNAVKIETFILPRK
jgi:hypothetical protein